MISSPQQKSQVPQQMSGTLPWMEIMGSSPKRIHEKIPSLKKESVMKNTGIDPAKIH